MNNMKNKILNKKNILPLIAVIICVAVFFYIPNPNNTSKYMMKVIDEGMLYFVAVSGLSVILGMGGQVTFSTAAMMGVGAYGTAYLTTAMGMAPVPAAIISIVAGGIFSFFLGLAMFRLKGSYFAFASIGLAQLMYTIYSNWMEVTGGPDGIKGIPKLEIGILKCANYYDYFRVYFIIAIVCFLIINRFRKTYFGRALASVRDNEINAKCMGINVYMTKVYSFVVAGVLACLAGAMYALLERYVSPDPFKYDQSAIYLIMVMLGGVDSTLGAFLGTMLLTILPEKLRFLQSYYKLVYGVGVIILMIVMPMGIMGLVEQAKYKLHTLQKKAVKGKEA